MNFELINLYGKKLSDPSVPSHRVVRKTVVVTLGTVGLLVYYRHIVLQFGFGEPALVTFLLSLLLFVIVGIFGGALTGTFYESFLKDVGASNEKPTITVFFAEWLFAATAPFLGLLLFGFLSQAGDGRGL